MAGSAFAIIEGTPLIPGTPQAASDIADELVPLGNDLNVEHYFPAWSTALRTIPTKRVSGVKAYVLILDLDAGDLSVVGTELYDLAQDPAETTNLSGKRPDVVATMRPLVEARCQR